MKEPVEIIGPAEMATPYVLLEKCFLGKIVILNFLLFSFFLEEKQGFFKVHLWKPHFLCRITISNLFNIKHVRSALAGPLVVFLDIRKFWFLVFSTFNFFRLMFFLFVLFCKCCEALLRLCVKNLFLIQFSQIGLMLSKSINLKLISKFKEEFESWSFFRFLPFINFFALSLGYIYCFFCYRRSCSFSRELLDVFSN